HLLQDAGHRWRRRELNVGRKCTDVGKPELSERALGTDQLRPNSSIRLQWYMESPESTCRTPTRSAGGVGRCWGSYDSIRQRSYHCGHQYRQRFWNKPGPGTSERHLFPRTTDQGRGRCSRSWEAISMQNALRLRQLSGLMVLEPGLGTA